MAGATALKKRSLVGQEGRLVLQEVGVRDFKSTVCKIDRKALCILGFSDMTNDLTGQ
jgi:hypothetical protein